MLELALAYNFVTPYTAFLAVPESELGAMATTVAAARDRKRKIIADNPDVAKLDKTAGSGNGQVVAQATGSTQGISPSMSPPPAPQPDSVRRDVSDGDDAEDNDGPRNKRVASAPTINEETTGRTLGASRGHGCAGCNLANSGDGAASLLLVGLVAMMLRRRRRA